MKTTINIVLVVVVLGLFWVIYKPAFNTTTDNNDSSPSISLGDLLYYHTTNKQTSGYYTSQHLYIEIPSEKYRFKNLQLYPIHASPLFIDHHRGLGPYLTLQEGLAQHKLIITELSRHDSLSADTTDIYLDNADVNKLFIENISSDTILVIGGEVIQGGKQDRMIAQEFMVPPHSGKIDIAVYCVEHGRWTEEGEKASFNITLGIAPKNVREVSYSDDVYRQQEVWDKVSELHEEIKTFSPTGALAVAMEDSKITFNIKLYQDFFNKVRFPENVVGIVAVLNNEIVGCDIFAQPKLLLKYYSALISSYCVDVNNDNEEVVLSYSEVQTFFNDLLSNEASLEKHLSENGTQLKHKNYRLHIAAY